MVKTHFALVFFLVERNRVHAFLAIQTVDAKASIGSISQVWIDFAKFYEVHGDLDNARVIFEKATKSPNFKSVDELATIWC